MQRNILLQEGLEKTQGGYKAGTVQRAATDKSSGSIHGSSVVENIDFPSLFRMHASDPPTGRGRGQRIPPVDVSHTRVRRDLAEIDAEQDIRTDSCHTRDPRREVPLAVPLLLREGDIVGAEGPPQEVKESSLRTGHPTLMCSSEEVAVIPSGTVPVHGPVVAGEETIGALRGRPRHPPDGITLGTTRTETRTSSDAVDRRNGTSGRGENVDLVSTEAIDE